MINGPGDRRRDPWREGAWPVCDRRDTPLEWSPDPDGDTVQGPLDLCFVEGRHLLLSLDRNEAALLAARGRLLRVMLAGHHWFTVGGDDCPAGSLVYFLRLEQPLTVDWRQYMPVPRRDVDEPATRLHSGRFVVSIVHPVRFYESLLGNRAGEGNEICLPTLRHLLPTLLTIRLAGLEPTGEGGLASLLSRLEPAALNEDLAPYGLACHAWSIQAPGERRPAGAPATAATGDLLPA